MDDSPCLFLAVIVDCRAVSAWVKCDYCPSMEPLQLADMKAHYYAMHTMKGRQEVCDWEWTGWYTLAPGQFPDFVEERIDADGGSSSGGGGAFPSLKRSRGNGSGSDDDVAVDGSCVGGAGVGEDSDAFPGQPPFPDCSDSAPTGHKRARESGDAGYSDGTVVIPSSEQCVVAARSPPGTSTTVHGTRKHVGALVDLEALLSPDSSVRLSPEACIVDVFRDDAIPAFDEQLAEFASWSPLRQVRAAVVSVPPRV